MNDTTLTKEEKQYKRLTEEPVARLILELGLPTTISMLITNLYNMVDTWFVSQLGTSATGAVGVVFGLMAILSGGGSRSVDRNYRYFGSERIVQIAWKYGDHPSLCENLRFLYSGVGTGNGIQLCDEQCTPV